jgi:hypothetical protein
VAFAILGLLWAFTHDPDATPTDALGAARSDRADETYGDASATLLEGAAHTATSRGAGRTELRSGSESTAAAKKSEIPRPVAGADSATRLLRVRVAAHAAGDKDGLVLDYGVNENKAVREQWHGTVPLERDGALHVARLPSAHGRRVLVVEVRSQAKDVSSGIVRLGRPLAQDTILDVSLFDVGELLVVVQPPPAASGATPRSPFDGGGQAPALEVRRLDVVARASDDGVTPYGERVCAVVRAPRLSVSHGLGGSLYERVVAGRVRVEVE